MATQKRLFKVRDLRHKEKFVIDDLYLNGYAKRCGVNATLVYISLCRFANYHTQEAFPSEETIGEQHGISARTVRRGVKVLRNFNIIAIDRQRGSQGRMLSNIYILLDRSQWLKPEVSADLWRTKGQKEQETRGQQRPIKVTKNIEGYKEDESKASLSLLREDNPRLNEMIELFKSINPTYERLFPNKNQRASLERMIKKFGREQVESMIKFLPKIFGKPYAPVITNPCALERKLADLIAYMQVEKSKGGKVFTIKPIK